MTYSYEREKPRIFTEDGQVTFLRIRDKASALIGQSGAVMSSKVIIGDSFMAMACLDRLVELGELIELQNPQSSWGQYRVFIAPIKTSS